jgi:type I restriction enzyme S subunit
MALDNLSADVHLYYLAHYLRFRKLDDVISGSAQPQITGQGLSSLQIPLPPLEQQKKIAAILDAADAYRQKTKALIAKYDELTQSLFLYMFGDPVIKLKKIQFAKLSEVVNSNKIITYGIVQAGENLKNGVPYIRTGDIKNGKILIEKLQKTSPEIAKSYERSKCAVGDIVMSIRATVGTIAIVPPELDGVNLTQGTARISPDTKIIDRYFLYYCLKSKDVQLKIEKQTKGATFREITLGR